MTIARVVSNVVLGFVAAFLVIASLVFTASVAGWLMFGVALAVLTLVGLAQLDRRARLAEHLVDAFTGTLAVWAAVASVVFAGATVTWLSFAEATGFVVLALAGAGVATYELVRRSSARHAAHEPAEPARSGEELRAVA